MNFEKRNKKKKSLKKNNNTKERYKKKIKHLLSVRNKKYTEKKKGKKNIKNPTTIFSKFQGGSDQESCY